MNSFGSTVVLRMNSFGGTVHEQFWKYRARTVLGLPCMNSFGGTVREQFWRCRV